MSHSIGSTIAEIPSVDEKYTENGEITFNPITKVYTVWDETYADTVCTTNYPQVALAALKAYGEHYLDIPGQPSQSDSTMDSLKSIYHAAWDYAKQHASQCSEGYRKQAFNHVLWWLDRYNANK